MSKEQRQGTFKAALKDSIAKATGGKKKRRGSYDGPIRIYA